MRKRETSALKTYVHTYQLYGEPLFLWNLMQSTLRDAKGSMDKFHAECGEYDRDGIELPE